MNQLPNFQCRDSTCKRSLEIIHSTYGFMFKHYFRKGREILIKLATETGVSTIPYQEPTFILADKLTKISKVEKEDE